MRQIRQVLQLAASGKSRRAIARSLGISRDAVSDYLTRAQSAGLAWLLPETLDDAELELRLFPVTPATRSRELAEPDWDAVWQALKQKGATRQVLHEEWLAEHPDGMAYSYFCERLRAFGKTLKASMRQVHLAGDKVFVDYAGPTLAIHNVKTGEIRKAQIFVGVLGASNYIYAEAAWSQQLPEWIASHVRMFEHFGGVPQVVVCDNLKSAVIRASRANPTVHPTYLDMASHYGTMILPARPRKPNDKAKAEGGVLIVERWILFRLRKQVFTSLEDVNVAIRELLVDVNARSFKKLPGCRKQAFEAIDRPALQPLPKTRYVYAEFRKVRAGADYHFDLGGGHYYSVPNALRGRELEVRLTPDVVEVLHGGRRVASHARLRAPGKCTDPQHMDPRHRYREEWDGSADLQWATGVGPQTHAFLSILLAQCPRKEQGMRETATMKNLAREYGNERLEAACARAIAIGATELRHVTNILRTRLDQQPLPDDPLQEASFTHGNLRGAQAYH